MQDELKLGESTIFGSIPPQKSVRARFKMKLFYFIPFGTKQLQTASEAGEEAVPNEVL